MANRNIPLSAIVAAILSLGSVVFAYSGGDGSAENPFQIATKENLLQLADTVTDYSKCFILTANIDLEEETFSIAVIAPDTDSSTSGFQGTPFTGVFNGNGHTINNLAIVGTENYKVCKDYIGFFGYVGAGGQIRNLGIVNANDDPSTQIVGRNFVGGLVGYNSSGTLTSCYVTGSVGGTDTYSYVGGLVGYNSSGSITSCCATGAVSGTGTYSYVGGLVGRNDSGAIASCYATGTVRGYYVGGLIGENYYSGTTTSCYATGAVIGNYSGGLVGKNKSTITSCHATGTVSGHYDAGGLVGENWGMITCCYATGDVSKTGYNTEAGGLVGLNYQGTITSCYATGTVSGTGFIGGLVGRNYYGSITSCYATGTVNGPSAPSFYSYVGGLVGDNYFGTITSCYATGTVSGPGGYSYVGGLVGYNWYGAIISCFWDIYTSALQTSAGGDGKTTAKMKVPSTFTDAGWDLIGETANGSAEIWRMCADGVNYPKLTWQHVEAGDFACPDGVNTEDLLRLSQDWMLTYTAGLYGADATGDKTVNLADFAVLANHWLEGI